VSVKNGLLNPVLSTAALQTPTSLIIYIVTEAAALLDASKSDHFDYTENTPAAYTNTAVAFGKWI